MTQSAANNLPDTNIYRTNYQITIENGKVTRLGLDDFGWTWDGDQRDLVTFLARLAKSKVQSNFLADMEDAGIDFEMLKPLLLENLKGDKVTSDNDDGLYSLSGDNMMWRFYDVHDLFSEVASDLTVEKRNSIQNKFYRFLNEPSYEEFLAEYGKQARDMLVEAIKESPNLDEFLSKLEDVDTEIYGLVELMRYQRHEEALQKALAENNQD